MSYERVKGPVESALLKLEDSIIDLVDHLRVDLHEEDLAKSLEARTSSLTEQCTSLFGQPPKHSIDSWGILSGNANSLVALIEERLVPLVESVRKDVVPIVGVLVPKGLRTEKHATPFETTPFWHGVKQMLPAFGDLRKGITELWRNFFIALSQVIPSIQGAITQSLNSVMGIPEPPKPKSNPRKAARKARSFSRYEREKWHCSNCFYSLRGLEKRELKRCSKHHFSPADRETCETCGESLLAVRWICCPECGTHVVLQVRMSAPIVGDALSAAKALVTALQAVEDYCRQIKQQ